MKNRRQDKGAQEHSDVPNGETEDLSIEENHRELLLKMFIFLGSPFFLLFGFYHVLSGNWVEGLIDAFGGVGGCIGYVVLKQNGSHAIVARVLLASTGFVFLCLLFKAGEAPEKALWSLVYPLVTLFMLGKREGLIWIAVFYLFVSGLLIFFCLDFGEGFFIPALRLRFLIVLGLVSAMSFMFESVRDKTEKNMLQKKLFLARSEAKYRTAFHELKAMQDQLVQSGKLASIGELVSGVAHELNQPLMVIRGRVQLIRRILGKNEPLNHDELDKQLEPVEKSTKRMMNIINHLRTFSRQSRRTLVRLDMNQVVSESFTLISEQLRLHDIEVMEEYASGLPSIRGDKTQIEQVILNLIANARDAMDRGKGRAEGDDTVKKILKISTSEASDKHHLEIRITDSGEGISPEALDRIFDPFFSTKEVGEGTGLGLSISYGIVKDHGGKIEVAETGPEGTTFRILLPIADRQLEMGRAPS